MIALEEKAKAVDNLFQDLDQQIAIFQASSSLHCKVGCGTCCTKPDIEATPLEFLPLALQMHRQGNVSEWLSKLEANPSSICILLDQSRVGVGHCSTYRHRGLICRIFGFSARVNKYGKRELVTCQTIKSEQATPYQDIANQLLSDEGVVPVIGDYYRRLQGIDPFLAGKFLPVNLAIREAIMEVLQYFSYHEFINESATPSTEPEEVPVGLD